MTRSIPQCFLRTLLGLQGCSLVDVMRAHGCIGKHGDLIRLHLENTAADKEVLLLSVRRLHAHFTGLEQSQERRMPGGNAEVALRRWREKHGRLAGEDLTLSADDVNMNSV